MIGPDSKNFISRKYGIPLKVSIAEITNQTYNIEFILDSELKKEKNITKQIIIIILMEHLLILILDIFLIHL